MAQENQLFAASGPAPRAQRGDCRAQAEDRSVAFMFAGMDMAASGQRDFGMGADLYGREPVFRAVIDACLEELRDEESILLRHWLSSHPDDGAPDICPAYLPSATLPFLFSAQIALGRLWMARGIQPAAMIGHGSGEYAAAHLAGVFSLTDAIKILRAHGRFLETQLWDMPFPVQSTAFHAILSPFHLALASVTLHPAALPFVSTLTGDWITPEQATDPLYWAGHLHRPDRFKNGLAQVMATPDRVLLNIGPGRTLSELVGQHPGAELVSTAPTAMGTSRTPLFLIHDGSGSIAIYEALAGRMVHDRPILGIEPKPNAEQPTSIAQMAQAYIARMLAMQPHGPFLLAGLGAGGVIAFEMAQQLQAMGERTAFVGIIDGADVEAHEKIFYLARPLFRAGLPVRRPASEGGASFRHVWEQARRAHHPHGVFEGGDVVVFKTTCGTGARHDRPASMRYTDCLLGWGKRVAGEVKLVMVPGGYHSALQEPHVESLARALCAAVASATFIRPEGLSLQTGGLAR